MQAQKIIAVVGLNASGKTRHIEQMRRLMASDSVRYIAFSDSYGAATDRAYYLQLRWNQHDIDKETPLVGDQLEHVFNLTGEDTPERRQLQNHLYHLFCFHEQLNKYVITLSSGELRKFQLIKTLLSAPSTLILDNPFIGLDAATRQQLNELLYQLAHERHITIYLIVARQQDIPDYVDQCIWTTPKDTFSAVQRPLDEACRLELLSLPTSQEEKELNEIVSFHDVTIRYGQRTILHHLNWTIRRGDCWALTGENGSGKSALLSLICADNPQAYACDIRLFGKQRGSGESIWQIKKRIGYVSPEMHRSYQHNITAIQVVGSGLKDTVGLYTRLNDTDRQRCRWWMHLFGVDTLEQRPFLSLSSGEQRMILLARAFVKDPELLILDEPLHGLDAPNSQLARDIIQTYSQRPNKTIIMVTHYEEELPPCFTLRKQLIKQQ